MKKLVLFLLTAFLILALTACELPKDEESTPSSVSETIPTVPSTPASPE